MIIYPMTDPYHIFKYLHIHNTISRYSSKYRIVTRILHGGIWLFCSLEKNNNDFTSPIFFGFRAGINKKIPTTYLIFLTWMIWEPCGCRFVGCIFRFFENRQDIDWDALLSSLSECNPSPSG